MKHTITILAFLAITCTLNSCKKKAGVQEEPANQQCFADVLASDEHSLEYGHLYKGTAELHICPSGRLIERMDRYYYRDLCVNPSNANQIAFIRVEDLRSTGAGIKYDLCVYDACTRALKVIANNAYYSPDWSSTGWIIYTGTDKQLYKVQANGENLTKLTNTGTYNNDAKWSPDGSKYIYQDASLGAGKMRISYANGDLFRQMDIYMSDWNFKNNDEVVYMKLNPQSLDIYKYNLNTLENVLFSSTPGIQNLGTRFNVVNNIAYFSVEYARKSDMYQFDLNTNTLSLIDSGYQTYYSKYPIPVGRDNFVLHRTIIDSTGLWECKDKTRSLISIFNSRTKTERYLKLLE